MLLLPRQGMAALQMCKNTGVNNIFDIIVSKIVLMQNNINIRSIVNYLETEPL